MRHAATGAIPTHVWYSCYGSNLSLRRFRCYLEGGTPPGSRASNCGSSDHTPLSGSRPGEVAGWSLVFARQSESWADRDQGEITYKGGVAFIEAKPAASILVRSYRVTVQQFKDVFWQENSCNLRIENVDLSIDVGSSSEIGRGWYAQIIRLPDIAGEPAFTFTDPTVSDQPHRAPSRSYLRTIIRGMVETFRLEEEADLIDYLRKCPGLATDQAACNDIPRIFAEERAVAR